MAFLEAREISKAFDQIPVLSEVSFAMDQGSILCILGPSGCGKTTLLRIIAGLQSPDAGAVCFEGRDMAGTPPHKRPFGMMFQDFALFPHLNVHANIAFGLQMRKIPRPDIGKRVSEMLDLVGLRGFEARSVSELSGGERQRVALARSLAPFPRLLLLDEPMGSLDRALRDRLLPDLKGILKRIGMTTVFVSHDQAEAFAVADRIAVLDKGRVEQTSVPEDLYLNPANIRVAKFLGLSNLIKGRVVTECSIETSLGMLPLDAQRLEPMTEVTVLIRPDAARMGDTLPQKGEIPVSGVVRDCLFKGRTFRLEMCTPGGDILVFELPLETGKRGAGERVELLLSASAMRVMQG